MVDDVLRLDRGEQVARLQTARGALIEIDDVAQVETVLDGVGGAEAGLDRRANAAVLERRLEELVLAADHLIGELLVQLSDVSAAVDVVGAAELDERIAGCTDLDRPLARQ